MSIKEISSSTAIAAEVPNCCICLDEIQDLAARVETVCKHKFHGECLLTWQKDNDTCPICRFKLIRSNEEAVTTNTNSSGSGSSSSNSIFQQLFGGPVTLVQLPEGTAALQQFQQAQQFHQHPIMHPAPHTSTGGFSTLGSPWILHQFGHTPLPSSGTHSYSEQEALLHQMAAQYPMPSGSEALLYYRLASTQGITTQTQSQTTSVQPAPSVGTQGGQLQALPPELPSLADLSQSQVNNPDDESCVTQ